VEKISKNPKFKAIKNVDIIEVTGDKFVDGIIYKDKISNETHKLDAAGIFVEIGQIPNTNFANDVLQLDEIGRITIDPWTGRTKTEGIWAAGDCTNVLYHQNNIAAGDAVRALEDIYLAIHTT
jgi:alkyl hydroperoxide reductase subunit F